MGILDFFRRPEPVETRSSGAGYTSEVVAARWAYVSGSRGAAELTATAQACISLWEGAFAAADVDGAPMLDRSRMAMLGRSIALRGEAVFIVGATGLIPAVDWDISTRNGEPRAYRLSIPEAGGGRSETRLAAEVLHVRIGADPATPWIGTAPLRRANLTAAMLSAVETALAEVYEHGPLGSAIVPVPEQPDEDRDTLGRGFRGQRGRILLRESVAVTAAGGPAPQQDWRASSVSPDLSRSMTDETLKSARAGICQAFGVLPSLFGEATTGPAIREGQRHLCQWVLEPIAAVISEEATRKLGQPVTINVARPMQAWDQGGRARALSALVTASAEAKERGVEIGPLLKLVDWQGASE